MKPSLISGVFERSMITLGVKVGTIVSAAIAMYHQDLVIIMNGAYQNELLSHILVIPFLLCYLIYRKRKMLNAVISFESLRSVKKLRYVNLVGGALLCLVAFFLYWHGSRTFTPLEYHILSLPIFVAGCTLIVFNAQTLRVLVFPIAFLLFLAPPPLDFIDALGADLSTISSEASFILLKTMGLPVSLEQYEVPVIVLTKPDSPPLTFAIDIACSGIYSLMGFLIFVVFIAYIARGVAWKKIALFVLGFPLIYIMNILRITTIVLIGNSFGMELALQMFHVLGGWTLIFLGTLLLLTISEKILRIQLFTKKSGMISCPECTEYPGKTQSFCRACGKLLKTSVIRLHKLDLAKITVIVLAMSLVLTIEVPVFALTEVPAEEDPTAGGTQILPEIHNYTLYFLRRDKNFEERAKLHAALTYAYIPSGNNSKATIFVAVDIAKSTFSLHRYEVCVARGNATQLDLRDIELVQNPPKVARFFAFTDNIFNLTQVVLYWIENAVFKSNSTVETKYVKIGVWQLIDGPDDVYDAESQLLQFGKAIANYWTPIKTWSQIALAISQNATILLTIGALLIAVIITVEAIRKQMHTKRNLIIYNKLSKTDKLAIQAIHKANEKQYPTTNEVISAYDKISEEKIELPTIIERLNHIKEIGLAELKIVNREDTPIIIWKAQTLISKSH